MPRFLNSFRFPIPVFVLGLFMAISLQGCNHLERGAITVNCDGDKSGEPPKDDDRGGCSVKDPVGELATNTNKPCNSGVVCEASGAKCSKRSAKHCKNYMLEGGDCTCACL